MNRLNKLLAIFLAAHLLLGSVAPVLAEEIPTPLPETTQTEDPVDPPDPEDEPDRPTHGSGRNDPENPGEPLGSGRNEPEVQESTTSQTSDGNTGNDTFIDTGDASSEGNIFNLANTNASAGAGCCGESVGVTNEGNGADSTNTGSATITDNNTTNQDNSANIDNGLTGASITG